jgi:hypothetical protein
MLMILHTPTPVAYVKGYWNPTPAAKAALKEAGLWDNIVNKAGRQRGAPGFSSVHLPVDLAPKFRQYGGAVPSPSTLDLVPPG